MYPKNFARFYDTIYHKVLDGVDNEFFLKHIRKAKGRVLEIGVGTGRFFIDALESGADIYGIDISENMIDVLLEKLDKNQHHRLSLQSIVDFDFEQDFDLIIAPFRVIMHIPDKEDQLEALNNVYRHLNSGGRFIFDTFVPDLSMLINGLDNVTDFDAEYEPGKRLKRTVSTRPDLINQLINVNFRLEWDEEGDGKEDWEIPLRFFFRYELEHLIERSKFNNYKIMGDYEGNPLNENSKEFVIVCIK